MKWIKEVLDSIQIRQPDGTFRSLTQWEKDMAMLIPGNGCIVKPRQVTRSVDLTGLSPDFIKKLDDDFKKFQLTIKDAKPKELLLLNGANATESE